MTFLDLILVLAVFAFVLAGLWFGLVHSLGALLGMTLSVLVAGHYAAAGTFGTSNLARVLTFLIISILVNRLIGLVFAVIERIFKIATVVPFLKTFNALLGGILGLIEGILVVGGSLYIAARFPVTQGFTGALAASQIGLWLVHAFGIFSPLLPPAIRQIQAAIP
jgi:uncharacterized membrane protein required for colicin V production